MFSSLMPLICRHDFYWSERRQADRCRRCGKLRADALEYTEDMIGLRHEAGAGEPMVLQRSKAPKVASEPALTPPRPSSNVLKAQARERRETLLASLQQLAQGRRPSSDEALDLVLAVIEDAHSSDPVLFGAEAAGLFAHLSATRSEAARLASTY